MAGPVGHMICALALINSTNGAIQKTDEYFAGNLFPDARYTIKYISRAQTHKDKVGSIEEILLEPNDFKKGQKLHIWLDKDREIYMKKHNAYALIPTEKYKSHILKLVEDDLLFNEIKGKFDSKSIFSKVYDEEIAYNIAQKDIEQWHELMASYLDSSKFEFFRYLSTALLFLNTLPPIEGSFIEKAKSKFKIAGLFCYAYYKIQVLSRNEKLKEIIFGYYHTHLNEVFSKITS